MLLAVLAAVYFLFVAPGSERRKVVAPPPKPAAPPPAPPQPPKPDLGRDWPQYGFSAQHTRYMPGANLRPPFRKVWSLNGGKLIEFSPVLERGRLFLLKNDGRAFAIEAATGRIWWRKQLGGLAASSPAASGGIVYFNANRGGYGGIAGAGAARLSAFNWGNGHKRWSRPLGSPSESSPLVAGGRVYVGSQAGTVYAFNAKTGRPIWHYQAGGPVKGALAFSKGRLFFGDYGGSVTALRAGNGSVVWRSGGYGEIYATVAVAFGRVYVGSKSGSVCALSESSGAQVWCHGTGAYVYAAPAVASVPGMRPAVFVGSYSGQFMALDARSGGVIWSHSAGGTISGAGSVIGNVAYFSVLTTRRTYALGAKTGRVLWIFGEGAFNPAISDGKRVYITGYGSQYAFTTPKELRRERAAAAKARAAKRALQRYRAQQQGAATQTQTTPGR